MIIEIFNIHPFVSVKEKPHERRKKRKLTRVLQLAVL